MFQNVNPSALKLWEIIKDEPKHRCFINHLSEDGKTSNWTSAETGLTGSSFLPWPLAARQNHPSRQLRILLLAAARLWLGSISASSLTQQRILRRQRAPGGSPGSQWEVVLPPPHLHLPDTFLADLRFLTPHCLLHPTRLLVICSSEIWSHHGRQPGGLLGSCTPAPKAVLRGQIQC